MIGRKLTKKLVKLLYFLFSFFFLFNRCVMSAAFPEITPHYNNVSPLLSEAVHENLVHFGKTTKCLLDMIQKAAAFHEEAASSIISIVDGCKKKMGEINKSKPSCQNESFQKFVSRIFEQMENQAKTLQSVSSSYNDCVVAPLQETVEKKKEIWKACFFYTSSFQQQIRKKEEDLFKRFKDYSDAASKLKASPEGDRSKQELMYHNSHNTYLLRLSSVNSMHTLLYTHVLPYVVHSIEDNQTQMNDSLRHHLKYMFSIQKETLKKISKSVDKIDHATDRIDLVSDLTKFIKKVKGQMKDRSPPKHSFSMPKYDHSWRASVAVETLEPTFVLNKYTGPNLQRRLAALQHQTGELVENIASLRAGDCDLEPNKSEDQPLKEISEFLGICDKEANLNVLLRQMELYTDEVTYFLGPLPMNILSERKRKSKSPKHQQANDGHLPHQFIQSRLMKPSQCFYCQKLVTTFVKGYVCKLCKMTVHKKCATNVPFCEGVVNVKTRTASTSSDSQQQSKILPKSAESAEVYDLIDLESGDDDDYDYFDDDEFDDAFSDEEEANAPQQHQPLVAQAHLIANISQFQDNQHHGNAAAAKPSVPKKLPPPILPQQLNSSPRPAPSHKPHNNIAKVGKKPSLASKPSAKPAISKKPVLAPKPSLPPQTKTTTSSCVALYDYRSDQSSDLSFISGSVFQILDKTDPSWWKGKLDQYEGYFPCSYVLEVPLNAQILRVLYAFDAENPKEISIAEGDILLLVENQNDWLIVKGAGAEGLVPSSYVEFI